MNAGARMTEVLMNLSVTHRYVALPYLTVVGNQVLVSGPDQTVLRRIWRTAKKLGFNPKKV